MGNSNCKTSNSGKCTECRGNRRHWDGDDMEWISCSKCTNKCWRCKGNGKYWDGDDMEYVKCCECKK